MPDPQPVAIDRATFDGLLEAVGGDLAFVAELVDAFRVDAPLQVASMRAALEAADAHQLAVAAHTLKSSSASLGATRLSARCAALEATGRRGQLAGAVADVASTEVDLEAALGELGRLVGTL